MVQNRAKDFKSAAVIKQEVKAFISDTFTYSTDRSATIQSKRVGVVFRLAQLAILIYIIGWDLIYNKGYQKKDVVSSVVTTKVKGQGYVPINKTVDNLKPDNPLYLSNKFDFQSDVKYRILDTADYVIPPNEYNSIFIMTNYVETEQTQGFCDEELNKFNSTCETDLNCQNLGTYMNAWNGVPTGRCIQSSVNESVRVCEISGWCPTEHDSSRKEDRLIRNVLNYTIFIKNDIEFKELRKKERNILSNLTNKFISKCDYEFEKICPVIKMDYILREAEPDPIERYKMLEKGGVVQIEINWECDYDWISYCLPSYKFKRFDLPFKLTSTASGFNFRYANRYKENNTEKRVLYKAYGIRVIINVNGSAGKFNLLPFMLTVGAGFGLMSISVIVADCVMLHCTKDKDFYKKMKELDIKDGLNFVEVTNISRV